MERVGYHTVAKLHAVWRARTMSILSRRGTPENACSPARRRCPPAPLRLLSLSPSSSFISVRKLSRSVSPLCVRDDSHRRRHQSSASESKKKKRNQPAPAGRTRDCPSMIQNDSSLLLLFLFFYSPLVSPTFRNSFRYPAGMEVSRNDVQ